MIQRDNADVIKYPTQVSRRIYQTEIEKDTNSVKIICIGSHEYVPVVKIFEREYKDILCTMVRYTVSDEELTNNKECKIFGIIFKRNGVQIGSLDLLFIPDSVPSLSNIVSCFMSGKFEIQLETIEKDDTRSTILKSFDMYVGDDEAMMILVDMIVKEHFIENTFF